MMDLTGVNIPRRLATVESLERRQLLSVPLAFSPSMYLGRGPRGASSEISVMVSSPSPQPPPGVPGGGATQHLEPQLQGSASGSFSTDEDIGAPVIVGSSSYNNGTYAVSGGGTDIAGTADEFHFVHSAIFGDGTFTARVTSLVNTNSGAKAGIMLRAGAAADAAFAGVFATPSSGLIFMTRATDGAIAGSSAVGGVAAPRWVRLVKSGNKVSAFFSNDGILWNAVGTQQTIALGTSPRQGLAVTSRNVAAATTAAFTSVSFLLPDGVNANDVGAPALPGFATFDSTTRSYAINGGGTGIGAAADQFNFASRNFTGGGVLTALVDGANLGATGKAALMIRSNLTGGAVFASVGVTTGGLSFDRRTTAGAASSSATVGGITGPVWLRLSQQGNSFAAYYSTNGTTFTQIGTTQNIIMPSALALAGMAVTSGSAASLASAAVSALSIVQTGWTDSDVGATGVVGSATFDPPSNTHTLAGGGTAIGGTADSFNFLSRTMTGDGNAVAYINALNAVDVDAKAGVMIRANMNSDAPFVGIFITPQNGVVFIFRSTAGAASTQQTSSTAITAPVSLRLIRTGNNVSGSYSTDGIIFTPIGTAVGVSLPTTALAGAAVTSGDGASLATAGFTGVAVGKNLPPGAGIYSATDEAFLHDLSMRSVNFFYTESNATTGQAPDGSNAGGGGASAASSIASTGFALTALTIGDQRGFLSHADAYQRALNTVNFLNTTAAQVNGFFYHFINPTTGARIGTSELSPMDTALLMAGVINVAQYWSGTPLEAVAMNVFNRVDWPWMQKPNGQFYGHWTPESGFAFGYGDFSEAVLIYLLGLGSSTHPTAASSWNSWARSPVINYNGFNFITAQTGALFTTQYPLAWYDLRGLSDTAGLNYHNNAATAALAQRQMAVNLSGTYPQYGLNNWGFSAADGQTGYTVFGGPPPTSNINGTVVPTAPGGSLAFIPRQAVDALQNMRQTYGTNVYRKYGFVDAFNPHNGWTSSIVLGIDVGMMLVAAENSRSNFVWNIFNQHPVARQSAARAFPSLKPSLQSAVTRKNTATLGNYDLSIPQTEELLVDERTGGPTQLVLTFGANVVKGPSFAATVTSGTITSSTTNGTTLTINLAGVTDAQTLVVNITDLRHTATSSGGSYTLRVGVLAGDADRSGAVNLDDFTLVAANFGQTPGGFPRGDFNFDGAVNLDDFTVLASQFGKTLLSADLPRMSRIDAPPRLFSSKPLYETARLFFAEEDEVLVGGTDIPVCVGG